MAKKVVLTPHEVILVDRIPQCDFCSKPGPYDFALRGGGWAHGCNEHYVQLRAASTLGTGKGQMWVTREQLDASE
jgi:hypothetical protein